MDLQVATWVKITENRKERHTATRRGGKPRLPVIELRLNRFRH